MFVAHQKKHLNLGLLDVNIVAAVHSKPVVFLLLFNHCFCTSPFVGALCLVCDLLCIILYPLQICNYLDEEERANCFILIVFLMSCDCGCSVALPHGVVG